MITYFFTDGTVIMYVTKIKHKNLQGKSYKVSSISIDTTLYRSIVIIMQWIYIGLLIDWRKSWQSVSSSQTLLTREPTLHLKVSTK